MEKKRVLVEINDKISDDEIRELMAKCIAIADRERGVSANFFTKCAVTLMPGQEVIVALRQGDAFDLIVQAKTSFAIPAGPMVGFFLLIPVTQ
jgi:hypothetical protein